ncbi:hypothetical protein [Sphingobium aromaticiconvertens]|uniref:hypothetical protein n=1 Tax=Sphingobium aromaticiconvertens TaxID=365341 RepID=UPI00301AE687
MGDPRLPIEDGAVICLHPIEVEGLLANGALEETDQDVTVEVISQFAAADAWVNDQQTAFDYQPSRDQVIAAIAELGGVAVFKGEELTGAQLVLIIDGLNSSLLIGEVVRRIGAGDIVVEDFVASPGIMGLVDMVAPIVHRNGAAVVDLKSGESSPPIAEAEHAASGDRVASETAPPPPPVVAPIKPAPAKAAGKSKAPAK